MFYEIYCNGEPTGMGSTEKATSQLMVQDYAMIYGGKCTIEVDKNNTVQWDAP